MADLPAAPAAPATPAANADARMARFRYYSLRELFRIVDLDRGSFAIGFKQRDPLIRERLQRGECIKSEQKAYESMANGILGYRAGERPQGWLAWLARHLAIAVEEYQRDTHYVHCEPAFFLSKRGNEEFGAENMLCVATSGTTPLCMYPRLFNDDYEWVTVGASRTELEAILGRLCRMQGDRFDFHGMTRCLLMAGPDKRRAWYCSYVVASVLELLRVPSGHLNRPNTLSVDDVAELVRDETFKPTIETAFPRRAFERSLNEIMSKFGGDDVV